MSQSTQTIQNQQNILGQISPEQIQKSQRKFSKWILSLLSLTEALSLKDSIHKTIEILIAASGGRNSFSISIKQLAKLFYGKKFDKNPDDYCRAMRRRLETLDSWQSLSGIILIQRLPNDLFLLPILNFLQSILLDAFSSYKDNRKNLKNHIIISAYALAHHLKSTASPSSPIPKPAPGERFLNYFNFKLNSLPLLSDPSLIQKEIAELKFRIRQDIQNFQRNHFRLSKYLELLKLLLPESTPSLNMGVGEGINFDLLLKFFSPTPDTPSLKTPNNSSRSLGESPETSLPISASPLSSNLQPESSENIPILDSKDLNWSTANPYEFEDVFPDETPPKYPCFTPEIPPQNSFEKTPSQPAGRRGVEQPGTKNISNRGTDIYKNTLCTNVQIEYAESMLKTLSKVGVKKVTFEFYIWVGEEERVGRGKMPNLDPLEALKKLPEIFERNKNGQEISIAIQDRWVIPLDDVKGEFLEKVKPFTLWIQESSPKNHHVLMGFQDIKTEKQRESILRRLKEGLQTDKGGSRIKLAGVVNQKPKHKENPPIVTPIKLDEEGQTTSEAELIYEGIIKREEYPKEKKEGTPPSHHVQRGEKKYRVEPYYAEYVARAPLNEAGKKPDISRADFAFCRTMVRRGFRKDEVVEALMRESKCAKGMGGGKYSEKTVKRVLESLKREGLPRD